MSPGLSLSRVTTHSVSLSSINKYHWDFPGGPVIKSSPSNAGDAGSIPGWGTKIPHGMGQLGPCATTEKVKIKK